MSGGEVGRLNSAVAGALLVVLGSLTWLAAGPVARAPAYTATPEPWLTCSVASRAALDALETELSPPDGATVQAGAPLTFSGSSSVPPAFEVASSRALLATVPDIDGGLGIALPPESDAYTFTSTKATATPATVYWNASFSTGSIAGCQGVEASTLTTTVRTLTVLPAPMPAPVAPPAPPAKPSPARVSLGAPSAFQLAHPTVVFSVRCTASCKGETYYHVLVVRGHGKLVRVRRLELSPKPISIDPAAGGSEQIRHTYSGSALRTLKGMIHAGDIVEIQIDTRVTDVAGNVAQTQRTVRI